MQSKAMQGCPFKFESNSSVVLFITVLVLVSVVLVFVASSTAGRLRASNSKIKRNALKIARF